MNAPEYRKSACCFYCRNSDRAKTRCLKFRTSIDITYVCAVFEFELLEEAIWEEAPFRAAKEDK